MESNLSLQKRSREDDKTETSSKSSKVEAAPSSTPSGGRSTRYFLTVRCYCDEDPERREAMKQFISQRLLAEPFGDWLNWAGSSYFVVHDWKLGTRDTVGDYYVDAKLYIEEVHYEHAKKLFKKIYSELKEMEGFKDRKDWEVTFHLSVQLRLRAPSKGGFRITRGTNRPKKNT